MTNILWTGKTTDMRKHYTAEGETYKELYEAIQEKYGYGNVIDEEYDNADKSNWSDDDYRDAIEESRSECYYHDFELEDEKDDEE